MKTSYRAGGGGARGRSISGIYPGGAATPLGGGALQANLTGPGGSYQVGELPGGQYLLEFSARPSHANYVDEYYDDESNFELADPVAVLEGSTTVGIDAELEVGGRIQGEVRTAIGTPLEEVYVCAKREEFFGPCAETDSGGDYELVGLPTDSYRVGFSPVYTGQNLLFQYWDHETSWASADPIPVTAGSTVAGIDGDLPQGAEIRGTVRSAATNQPLRWILVCAIEAASGELLTCAETDSLGGYALYGLPAGPFKVAFSLEFAEFFPGEPPEPDGWPTQFYNGKSTLALADVLNLTPPGTTVGIDARLGAPSLSPLPSAPPAPTKPKTRLHCKRGFHKKRVKGKLRCVRKHHRRRRHAGHRRNKRVEARNCQLWLHLSR